MKKLVVLVFCLLVSCNEPEKPKSPAELGDENKLEGRYEQAVANYTEQIAFNPDDATAYHKRADAYYEAKKYKQSLSDLEKVIELTPNNSEAYFNQSWVFLLIEDYTASIKAAKEVTKRSPENLAVHLNLGHAYLMMGHYEKALEAYKACKCNSRLKDSFNELNRLGVKHEDMDKVKGTLKL